jgi:hypothetical protein
LTLPTLSELIKACGSKTFWLFTEGDIEWNAMLTHPSEPGEIGFGPTPEEAVANLWLALNRK